jgi:hypothetical protein
MWPFVFIFLIAGIVMHVAGRRLEQQARRAAHWPTVDGALVRCEVVERPAIRGDSPSSWDLVVEYSYAVHGVTYRGTRYGFGFDGGVDEDRYRAAAQKLAALPVVRVHDDPRHPREAVLDTTVPTALTSLGRTGLVLAGVSTFFAIVRFCV